MVKLRTSGLTEEMSETLDKISLVAKEEGEGSGSGMLR
jgi:hypothetical protein